MSASETIHALEDGLITEGEAVEQEMVERVDDIYEKAASGRERVKPPVRRDAAR